MLNLENRYQGKIETPLSDKGRAQARQLAEGCRRYRAAALYSSPALRARQTAEPVSAAIGLPVQVNEGLREADMGELEGMLHRDVRTKWPELAELMRRDMGAVTFPGGESVRNMQDRAWAALHELAARHGDDTVIAVTHQYTVRALVCKVLELPLSRFESFDLASVCITTVETTPRGVRLVNLNDTCHVDAAVNATTPSTQR